jgi:hypothetical protein
MAGAVFPLLLMVIVGGALLLMVDVDRGRTQVKAGNDEAS